MPTTKCVEKDHRMCIKTKEKQKKGKTKKTVKAVSKFVFQPVVQVLDPKNGYIFSIKVYCDETQT